MLVWANLWVFFLLPLPLLVRLLAPAYRDARHAVRAPFFERLARLTGADADREVPLGRRPGKRWMLLGLSWVLILAAMARPVWLEEPLVREQPMRDLLIALDLSGSMETEDFRDDSGASVDRLTVAIQVLDKFLARRQGDRVALVFFGSAAFVQAPFTEDLGLVRELLDEAATRMLGPRTMLGDAIGLAITLFERSELEQRVLILLTDGNDTGSLVPPLRAGEIARDSGVVVHTVAMGDPANAGEQALDEATLAAVAGITGGGYFRTMDTEGLEGVYERLDALNPRLVESLSFRPERDLYPWPLGAMLLLSLGWVGVRHALTGRRDRPRQDQSAGSVAPDDSHRGPGTEAGRG